MDDLKALLKTSAVSGKAMPTALGWLDKQAEPDQRMRWVRPALQSVLSLNFLRLAR